MTTNFLMAAIDDRDLMRLLYSAFSFTAHPNSVWVTFTYSPQPLSFPLSHPSLLSSSFQFNICTNACLILFGILHLSGQHHWYMQVVSHQVHTFLLSLCLYHSFCLSFWLLMVPTAGKKIVFISFVFWSPFSSFQLHWGVKSKTVPKDIQLEFPMIFLEVLSCFPKRTMTGSLSGLKCFQSQEGHLLVFPDAYSNS